MTSTKVETRDNRELRRVEAIDGDGEVAGYAEYQISVDGNTFDFTHTEVDERFAGQGVGSSVAAGVMEFAREEGIRIVPSCKFLRVYMQKHEDTHDLLADEASLESDDGRAHDEDGSSDTGADDEETQDQDTQDTGDDDTDKDENDEDDEDDAEKDSPDAGPADAKAAGAGGATDEGASRS